MANEEYTNNEPDLLAVPTTGRFKSEPAINVISKEEFEYRVEKVFHLLWEKLAKSFGPYGAPTIICCYPYRHVTKDGYTIMKNLSMDASETLVDQAIADMASDICGRLNYSVGDGTTSAVISTNSIYQNYRMRKESLARQFVLPRDVIKKFDVIKELVIKNLHGKVRQIRSNDPEVLRKNIYDVVYVSSNGDEVITNYIADLYRDLSCPAITCELASDGITKKRLVEGYKYDITLNDRLYINSDDNTMRLDDADIVIFSSKVTQSTYQKILKPLNQQSQMRGRHLIVAAPFYDEVALAQVIAIELNNEYAKRHDVNMVLMTYKAVSAHTRKLVEDFAMLSNTFVIDKVMERTITEQIESGTPIYEIFNLDHRNINGTKQLVLNTNAEDASVKYALYTFGTDECPENYEGPTLVENPIRLGYLKDCALGLKSSLFGGFAYDEDRYNAVYNEAKTLLAELEAKYQKLGTFNLEVSLAQKRLYSLNLKMGVIEVGADTELSQTLIKDAVDDAVKAAASAYEHGVIMGCNVSLIQTIREVLTTELGSDVDRTLGLIIYNGFMDVYRTVLTNAFDDIYIYTANQSDLKSTFIKDVKNYIDIDVESIFSDDDALVEAIERCINDDGQVTLHNVIIHYSEVTSQVFDVSQKRFSTEVINSTQTDEEILKATIDLISLLIVGNQMVVTQKHNF